MYGMGEVFVEQQFHQILLGKFSCCVSQAPSKECATENYFSYFSTKTYVVGTQKNRLDETVLLSTQNMCLN